MDCITKCVCLLVRETTADLKLNVCYFRQTERRRQYQKVPLLRSVRGILQKNGFLQNNHATVRVCRVKMSSPV